MSGKRIDNQYEIQGDLTILWITDRKNRVFRCLLDTKNLKRIRPYSWHMRYAKNINGYYVIATVHYKDDNGNKKQTTIEMHSFLMNNKRGKYFVDHKNNDGTDNREENLRVTSHSNNEKNRKGANKNNKSGYRNVAISHGKLLIQLQINGKNTVLKTFPLDQLEDAGKYAEEMRKKYYGDYAGKG